MRINQSNKNSSKKGTGSYWVVILFFLITSAVITFLFLNKDSNKQNDLTFFCDSEKVSNGFFSDSFRNESYSNGNCQSEQAAYQGEFGCLCNIKQIYGFTKKLDQIQKGDVVTYCVYAKNINASSALIFSSKQNELFKSKKIPFQVQEWTQICDTIRIPHNFIGSTAKVYPYLVSNTGEAYFDNLEIKIDRNPLSSKDINYTSSDLKIRLTNPNLTRLKNKRNEAKEIGLLYSSKDDLVDADLKIDEESFKAKIRLKGDLLDHLQHDRWSFRIILKGGDKWMGMNTFSIHNSKARSHLAEWVMHELFRSEGILTPKYDFLKVELNAKKLGVYAYEQHFDNHLLISNKRRIGPILKHNDDAYWNNVLTNIEPFPWHDAADIELFNKENSKDENFMTLFNIGQSMLSDFLDGRKKASEVFNLEKIAKYYALLEISHALHAQLLTNIRFYLDPNTGLLEPIGFDCFGDHLPNVTPNWTAIGEGFNKRMNSSEFNKEGNKYMYLLLSDSEFFARYMHYLELYTQKSYLQKQRQKLDASIQSREQLIRTDKSYKDYKYNWEQLFSKAKFTRKKLFPNPNLSLKVFKYPSNDLKIIAHSMHYFPVEIVGYGLDDQNIDEKLENPEFIDAYNSAIPILEHKLTTSKKYRYVYYKVIGLDSIYSEPISKLTSPIKNVILQKPSLDFIKDFKFVEQIGREIIFSKGTYDIDHKIIIPDGHQVTIAKGTKFIFGNGGAIMSYSPIKATGSKKMPIQFIGLSENSMGVYISSGTNSSIFEYCHFENLNSYTNKNIQTDGALSLFQTNADLSNCRFNNMNAKDALNIQYSKVKIKDTAFTKCKGDAIDADYSNVTLENTNFEYIGKDALEIGGGKLQATNTRFSNILNTGIKMMQFAEAYFLKTEMSKVDKGIDISEHAKLNLNTIQLNNAIIGFQVLSSELPHTQMTVVKLTYSDTKKLYIMNPNASLTINGENKKAN